jgi:cobalt transport protein ATP-binding subunit
MDGAMRSDELGVPIVQAEGLAHVYEGEVAALKGVDLKIRRGEFVGLIGQNGSGKTTLAKHFNGLLRPTSGRVMIDGADIVDESIGRIARKVGFVFQNPDHQVFCPSVEEECAFGPRNLGLSEGEVALRVGEALSCFKIEKYAEHPPAVLGFGIRRKVSLAAVYAMRPEVLILDEPTAGLDWKSSMELMRVVRDLNRDGHTVILITHDMRIVAEYTTRSVVLKDGRIIMDDSTREVMADPEGLRSTQIAPPQVVELSRYLRSVGALRDVALSSAEFADTYSTRPAV